MNAHARLLIVLRDFLARDIFEKQNELQAVGEVGQVGVRGMHVVEILSGKRKQRFIPTRQFGSVILNTPIMNPCTMTTSGMTRIATTL